MKVSADTLDQIFISQGRILRHESFIASPTAQFENVLTGEKITAAADSAMVDDLELADSQAVSNLVYGVYELQEKYEKVLNESIDFHSEKSELQRRIAELQEENAALRATDWDRIERVEGVDRGAADDVAPRPTNKDKAVCRTRRRRKVLLPYRKDPYPSGTKVVVDENIRMQSIPFARLATALDADNNVPIYTLPNCYDTDVQNPKKLPFMTFVYE